MKWWVGAFVLLLAGFVFRLGLLVYAMYVLVGALFISRYLTRAWMKGIVVSRACSAAVLQIGEIVKVETTIANRGLVSIPWLLCEDFLSRHALVQNPPALEVKGARLTLLNLRRGESKKLSYQITCRRRGYYQIGPLLLETGDLFGLHRRFRIAADPHFILVLPRVVPLRDYDLASPRPTGEIRVSHRLFEDPTLIAGIKQYERGEPLNRIHWRATARMGELQSKVFQPSRIAGITILLDLDQRYYGGSGGPFREDLAVVTAASLGCALFEMGQRFGLVSNGRDAAARIQEEGWRTAFQRRAEAQSRASKEVENVSFEPIAMPVSRGEAHYEALLEVLGRAELSNRIPMSDLVRSFSNLLSRNTTIVAVVSAVDVGLAEALGSLRQRGYHVIAVVIAFDEAALSDWAKAPEWVQLLVSHGIKFHRVDNDESLSRLCSAVLLEAC